MGEGNGVQWQVAGGLHLRLEFNLISCHLPDVTFCIKLIRTNASQSYTCLCDHE